MAHRVAAKRTILLVDADPSLRTVARLHLGPDVELVEASDARAALDLMSARQVDLAICAVDAPRVEGAECLRQLRSHPDPRVRGTPVLLLADGHPGLVAPIVAELGPAATLEAPITGPRLAEAVGKLMRG